MNNLLIKILPVGCGDAIYVRFLGNDHQYHNILIDGGLMKFYKQQLKPIIKILSDENEFLDLVVLTHHDADHIGGIKTLIDDISFDALGNFVKEWWINFDLPLSDTRDTKVSVSQLKSLKEKLNEANKCPITPITNQLDTFDFWGARITILSPDNDSYQAIAEELSSMVSNKARDHNIPLLDLKEKTEKEKNFQEDDSPSNRSSISFLFEYDNFKILFLADSHPSVVVNKLKDLGYNSEDNRLKVDYVKVSHHGSKGNTSKDLLDLIDCDSFILSTNGNNSHKLPDKEALVRIIFQSYNSQGNKVKFYFNHKDDTILSSIFDVDNDLENKPFELIFPITDILTISY